MTHTEIVRKAIATKNTSVILDYIASLRRGGMTYDQLQETFERISAGTPDEEFERIITAEFAALERELQESIPEDDIQSPLADGEAKNVKVDGEIKD
jgi:hypothetical protein